MTKFKVQLGVDGQGDSGRGVGDRVVLSSLDTVAEVMEGGFGSVIKELFGFAELLVLVDNLRDGVSFFLLSSPSVDSRLEVISVLLA